MTGDAGSEKKTSWPEVLGLPAKEAEKIIKKDMPEADIVVLASDAAVPRDLKYDRVRIFVDTVTETPKVDLSIPPSGKTSWPEVVGISVKEAKELIFKEKPNAKIEVLTPFDVATRDSKPNRVQIDINTVAETPVVG